MISMVDWKYTTMVSGALFVMMAGVLRMLMWPAGKWGMLEVSINKTDSKTLFVTKALKYE